MKKLHLLTLIFTLSFCTLWAQTTEVVTGLSYPSGLQIIGTDLYIAETGANKISKVDLTSALPTAIDSVVAVNYPSGLVADGNDLYVSAINTIYKFDITSSSPTIQTVHVAGILNGARGMALDGNDLYIASFGYDNIVKLDLATTPATPTNVFDTILYFPYDVLLNGNDLYIAERGRDRVTKLDITATPPLLVDVVTGLDKPFALALNGNDLYIAEYGANKVSKIDITAPTPIATDVVTGLYGPTWLLVHGSDLYISETDSGKVSKISLGSFSVEENDYLANIKIYPNPAQDIVNLDLGSVFSEVNIEVISLEGKRLIAQDFTNDQFILLNISALANGLYVIRIVTKHSSASFKFIKG